MKVNRLFVFILLCSQNCFSASGGTDGGFSEDQQLFFLGEGGHGGGPRCGILLSNGRIGGGARLSIEGSNKIDNIEVDNKIRFLKTFKEKYLLPADSKIQTIQFNNGKIITIPRIIGEGGFSSGGHIKF